MTGFEAYQLYHSLKLHFMSESYDFFKYNGKSKVTEQGFNMRKDRFWFQKLAKHRDPKGFILANIINGDLTKWIGGLLTSPDAENIYLKWLKYQQSISYEFAADMKAIENESIPFNDLFVCKQNIHPVLFKRFLANKIGYEPLIILDDILNYFPIWNRKMKYDVIWQKVELKCTKYKPFLKYDKNKLILIVKEYAVPF